MTTYIGGKPPLASVALLAIALLVAPVAATLPVDTAGTWVQTRAFVEPTQALTGNDELGATVALAGDTAFVGAPGEDAVYVYERVGPSWIGAERLQGPSGFGRALAADDGIAVVGAQGAAFVFEEDEGTWTNVGELSIPGVGNLATGVAVDGSTVAVSQWGSEGAVYIFEKTADAWLHTSSVSCSECGSFADSIALDGDTLVVGVPYIHVYIYQRDDGDAWVHAETLAGPASHGRVVALGGDVLAVGVELQDLVFVYAWEGGTWVLAEELEPPEDLVPGAGFGSSVAVAEDTGAVIVGARFDDASPAGTPASPVDPPRVEGAGVPEPGALHVFTPSADGWEHGVKLLPIGATRGEQFGSSVAVSADGTTILAGAPDHKRGPSWVLDFVGVPYDRDDAAFVFEQVGTSVVDSGEGLPG